MNADRKFSEIVDRYKISREFADRLRARLTNTKVVYIFDDSSSMGRFLSSLTRNESGKLTTRWDEMKSLAKISFEIASIFNPEGLDVHFLNRPAARNVRGVAELATHFAQSPNGFSTITKTLQNVLAQHNRKTLGDKKLLLLIVTDNEPTDEFGLSDIAGLKRALESRDTNVFTNILCCTDDRQTVSYLNDWDRIIPRLDVLDDYANERAEIQRVQGRAVAFSEGDYIAKSLIGSLDMAVDTTDEGENVIPIPVVEPDRKLREIIERYKISPEFAARLKARFSSMRVVYILDDSSSMEMPLNDSPLNVNGRTASRWDELKQFARISFEIASIFNPEGVDVFFLNRPPARNVKSLSELETHLVARPDGNTPLRRAMQSVLAQFDRRTLANRNLLVVIMTDGEPTDDNGADDIPRFKSVLEARDSNVFTTIGSCTDDDGIMSYLNNWDKTIPRLDVVDDYRSEVTQIQRARGKNFQFSYGDYVVKFLVGSLDADLDRLDEEPVGIDKVIPIVAPTPVVEPDRKLREIIERYKISPEFAARLKARFSSMRVVYILDDSSSMEMPLNDSPLNVNGRTASRWDELKQFARISFEIASIFNPEGVDVFFLNRPPARNVKSLSELETHLVARPDGNTPLRRAMQSVLAQFDRRTLANRNLLVVIMTDGEPTDDNGADDIPRFKSVLEARDSNVFTTIGSCTDDDGIMSYLNNWDKTIPRLDVVDDYRSEVTQIQRARGKNFQFSYGDYVVKFLVGSFDDNLIR